MPLWQGPLAVVCPAGGHLRSRASAFENAVYPVGDRLAHTPPFTGDGLAIAHVRRGASPGAYLAEARRMMAPAIRLAAFISRTAAHPIG